MEFLVVPEEVLDFIRDSHDKKINITAQDFLANIIKVIAAIKTCELNNKLTSMDKLSSNIVLETWTLMPFDRIRNKKQRWDRHYKDNITLVIYYFESIKNLLERPGANLSQEQLGYLYESLRDTALQYIGFKQDYEHTVNDLDFMAPAGISNYDHSSIKNLKLVGFMYRNHGYQARELIPPVAFEIRQIIETKLYNCFGLEFSYKIQNNNIEPNIIPMKTIFDFLNRDDVKTKIKFYDSDGSDGYLKDLEVIYRWSNSFIHTANFPYYWQIFYVLHKIHPLCCGLSQEVLKSKSINLVSTDSAIQIKKGELENIQNLFKIAVSRSKTPSFFSKLMFWRNKSISSIECHFGKPTAIEV